MLLITNILEIRKKNIKFALYCLCVQKQHLIIHNINDI